MRGYTTARPHGCGSVSRRQRLLELDYMRISNEPSVFVVVSGVWRMQVIVKKGDMNQHQQHSSRFVISAVTAPSVA